MACVVQGVGCRVSGIVRSGGYVKVPKIFSASPLTINAPTSHIIMNTPNVVK